MAASAEATSLNDARAFLEAEPHCSRVAVEENPVMLGSSVQMAGVPGASAGVAGGGAGHVTLSPVLQRPPGVGFGLSIRCFAEFGASDPTRAPAGRTQSSRLRH